MLLGSRSWSFVLLGLCPAGQEEVTHVGRALGGYKQKGEGKRPHEPQVKRPWRSQKRGGSLLGAHMSACCRTGPHQGMLVSLRLQPHKTPWLLLEQDQRSRSCTALRKPVLSEMSKTSSHSHSLAPCRQCGSVFLKCFTRVYTLTKSCLADHQRWNGSSNTWQAQTMGTPKTLLWEW